MAEVGQEKAEQDLAKEVALLKEKVDKLVVAIQKLTSEVNRFMTFGSY